MSDHLGVGTRGTGDAPLLEPVTQVPGVDNVAVVAKRDLDVWAAGDDRLCIPCAGCAGRGVACVADG